ncbi:serine hydrolase [Algoriphagus halophytocola]|uniref:Beta-lactamase family protein n=1 Tax=Algoriphagus halophytocola TaxID=2991499 RepID=A0ABY6MD20_9BACT|nr:MULTISPECIES: serine hydrolase domain-containing protein [unclassified Algoriphagus]UZD21423.1 beta-lactamase family protein [Algoriphagus sp. TR-M5]WBL42635.1 serine hydrolase [Algoriphagus sp. TR-M9]
MKSFRPFLLLLLMGVLNPLFAQQRVLKKALKRTDANGFSGVVLTANKGKILVEEAIGLRSYEESVPLETTDIFELASLSKQFTAMMVMICKEKGLLQFDDMAENYVAIPYKGISIRNLLTHTSGLPDYQAIMDEYWDKSQVAGNPEILEYLRKYAPPKSFEPGEKYEYSNTGYVILASIVEKVTGEDFVKLSKEWIFEPLEMQNTAIRSLEEKANVENFAAGHLKNKQGQYVNANTFHSSDYTVWLGNRKGPGRVSSSAEDLLKWDQALYTDKLVSQKTLTEAFTPFELNNGTLSYYGFGWEIKIQSPFGKVVMHTGSNPGYSTIIARYIEENKTVIVLNNNAHPDMMKVVESANLSFGKK